MDTPVMECEWAVWVGGLEVNEFHLPIDEAQQLALEYLVEGYEDVAIENVNTKVVYRNNWKEDTK